MTTEQNSFKTTEISRPTKGDFEKTLKVNRRGQNHWMLKIRQHFGKQYGVQKSSISRKQNGLTKQKRGCHLKNRIQ